jgi:hypothetical protein
MGLLSGISNALHFPKYNAEVHYYFRTAFDKDIYSNMANSDKLSLALMKEGFPTRQTAKFVAYAHWGVNFERGSEEDQRRAYEISKAIDAIT